MQNVLSFLKIHSVSLLKLTPLIAFGIPLLLLYELEPTTFEAMWKGRTFQLFFVWLIGLELILGWEDLLASKIGKSAYARTVAFIAALTLPTLYIVASKYWGINEAIFSWATQSQIIWANTMPLSTEYFVFATSFAVITYLAFGIKGLKAFSVPLFFLTIVGAIYTIDNVYPYGQFAPFQILVPTTTTLAAYLLSLMGYTTSTSYVHNGLQGTMPQITAVQNSSTATFSIAWPCAGIESFLIFTVVILLFLKRMHINLKCKIGFFVFGAAITYLINALRIVNIFRTGIIYGENSMQVQNFHFYYGPLYAIAWIVSYPLLILLVQNLLQKRRKQKPQDPKTQLVSLSLA